MEGLSGAARGEGSFVLRVARASRSVGCVTREALIAP